MITVCCVFVRGHVPYTAEYVVRLKAMVHRWMERPYRFVALTDRPTLMTTRGIEAIHVEPWPGIYAWWTKVHLFRPDLGLTGRVLYLDLDTLVVRSLAPILDYPAPFALIPHSGKFEGKGPRAVVKRFNSSVMVWTAGATTDIWTSFEPRVSERLFGDQDFIGEVWPDADMMPLPWFPRISEIKAGPVPPEARVVLMKTPKTVKAAQMWPWVKRAWMAR